MINTTLFLFDEIGEQYHDFNKFIDKKFYLNTSNLKWIKTSHNITRRLCSMGDTELSNNSDSQPGKPMDNSQVFYFLFIYFFFFN